MKYLLSLVLLISTSVFGQDTNLLSQLQGGGYIVFFRHAITPGQDPFKVNPPNERIEDCSSQRPLNDEGREQAKQIGEKFRQYNIPVGEVVASPVCRCYETAQIAFGKYNLERWIANFDLSTLDRELRKIPPSGTNKIFVGHHQNIANLYKRGWRKVFLKEGEAVVVDPRKGEIIGVISILKLDILAEELNRLKKQ